jgi:hypothetical protein
MKKILHLGNFGWTYWSNIGGKLYQYWVGETTPIANSPALVKQQTLIQLWFCHLMMMAVFRCKFILICLSYPVGQEREVTVLQTGQAPYAWSTATTNL